MKKIRKFLTENKLIFAAFFLPVLITVLAFAVTGIYPFGDKQIAVIDMYHQYVPFLSELQYKLQEGGSLFYTWNGAGGSNFWNLLAYYGASPLNLLLILFPQKMIMEGVTFILLIKIGLAGSFMAIYLRYAGRQDSSCSGCRNGRVNSAAILAFAVLYALCSYVMAYYWCIMWMDAVALFPLIILGLNRIIDGGSPVLYTVTLALTVFSNYYMAIMVCIFIMFYYPVLYFIKVQRAGARVCAATTVRAVGYSFLAIAMSAVMLLPTYVSMQNTYYISSDMPEKWRIYNDALDVINQLLPNAELTYRDGLPNLYCGMAVVILLAFYMISRSITLREKLLNGAFLIFMFFSLNLNKLDFLWHGLHFPNQLPFRYTFVICFLLIGMAYKAFCRIDEFSAKNFWAVLGAGTGYYLIAQKLLTENIDDMDLFFYSGVAWLALYCGVFILYKYGYLRKCLLGAVILVMVVSEMASNTCTSFEQIGNTYRNSYFENYDDVRVLAEETVEEFVRTEMDYNYILNCPALYHYRGLSQFSSSVNSNATALMEKVGLDGAPSKNRYNYNQTDPVTNAMLNVKYIIAKNLKLKDPDFKLADREGNSRLYESKYPLSIGYMTGNEIRTWKTESTNPFEVLDDYVRAATGNAYTKVFNDIGDPVIKTANAEAVITADGYVSMEKDDSSQKSAAVLKYTAKETGKHYVFIETYGAAQITVSNGNKLEDIDIRNDCGSIVNIGTYEKGEKFRITIKYDKEKIGDITVHVCTLDQETWDKAYEVLSEEMMTVTDFGDNYLKGTVEVSDAGVLVTSIPYEKGWKLEVDGRAREISELAGDAFIATSLDEGTHEIYLRFRPPGLIAGIIISILAAALLAVLQILRKKIRKRKTSMQQAVCEEDQGSLTEGSDCMKTA